MKKEILIYLLSFVLTQQVYAQQDTMDLFQVSFEELMKIKVSTSSKQEETVTNSPGLITVLSKKEIEGFAAVNLGQVLNQVVGGAFLSPDVFTDQTFAIRGQEITPYNNHVLFLLNGRPLRDPISGGMNSSVLATFPLSVIQQIEIIRGPGSVLYGSCAYSGVINIITQNTKEKWSATINPLSYGSYHFLQSGAKITFQQKDFSVLTGVNYFKDNGPVYEFYDYNGLKAKDNFDRKGQTAFVNMKYKGFSLNTYYGNFNPYSLDGNEIWAKGYHNEHTSFLMDLGYEYQFSEKLKLNVNLTNNRHIWGGYSGTIVYDSVQQIPVFYSSEIRKTIGLNYLGEITCHYQPIKKLNFILGIAIQNTDWKGGRLINGTQNAGFSYLQTDYYLHKKIKLIGGIQYNKIENINGNVSLRTGIITNFTSRFGAKILYSEAYRRAYPLETSFNVVVFRGNPNLAPEKIRTQEIQLFYHTQKLQTSVSYYYSHMYDLITRKRYTIDPAPESGPNFYFQYLNNGQWTFQGLEFEFKYSVLKNLLLVANANYQWNQKEGFKNASLHPNFMIKTGILYQKNKYSIGLFNNYVGAGQSTDLVNNNSKLINNPADAYSNLSLKITYQIPLKDYRINVFGQLDNILNQEINYVDYPNKGVNTLVPLSKGRTYLVGVSLLLK